MPQTIKAAFRMRVQEAREMGWLNIVPLALCGIFLAMSVWILPIGIDNLRATWGGMAGTVTITECEPELGRTGGQIGWDCAGTFRSFDESVMIDHIAFKEFFEDRPSDPVPARVSGPNSTTAHMSGSSWVFQMGFGAVALGAVFSLPWWWFGPRASRQPATRPNRINRKNKKGQR
ncbi:hypothetical protein AB0B66_25690 [Catellatospora sp. NPDC049111]|uniref:hypothetical protein n=1 Tax=Catellatospora sp. NPDC049111 TaxID=3155271 RepID=UPI0033D132E0